MQFSDLRLAPSLLSAVKQKGFETPTPIQEKVIPILLEGIDVIGQAKTGTGKTAAFGLSILHLLEHMPQKHGVLALVLTPTRELAVQVAEEINELAAGSRDKAVPVYGGQSMDAQLRELSHGARIIIATPGRMIDHIKRGTISIAALEILVIDEADRMLDMGFIDDVEYIIKQAPAKKQLALFSATMPHEVVQLANKFMGSPEFVKASGDEVNVSSIAQHYMSVDPRFKISALSNLLRKLNPEKAIVFCRTKYGAERLAGFLHQLGFDAISLHGNLSQNSRDRAMDHFEGGNAKIMVATDLASRGLDVEGVQVVVNYDLPEDEKVYLHRIGRTGRAGSTGQAYSLATNLEEIRSLRSWGTRIGAQIAEVPADTTKAPFVREPPRHERGHLREGRFGGRGGGVGARRGPRFGGGERYSGGGHSGHSGSRGGGSSRYNTPGGHHPPSRSPPARRHLTR